MPNYDQFSGVSYGVASRNDIDPEVVQELMYGEKATDLSYQEAVKETAAQASQELHGASFYAAREFMETEFPDELDELSESIEEPIIEGELDGVKYRSTWLGGALHFFIFHSPVISLLRPCSPCVPGAHDIHRGDEKAPLAPNVLCHTDTYGYAIPDEWEVTQ